MSQRIDDGFQTLITFSSNPNIKFEEIDVKPPGVTGGGPNDVTNMRNTAWRTRSPKKLKTLTDGTATVAYDPAVLDEIIAMVNINQEITIEFPDDSKWTFWGWLDEFDPNPLTEGERATATVRFCPSNHDNTTTLAEQAPEYIPAP